LRLLYYCPVSVGGLADYAHEQASALARLGVAVNLLATGHPPQGADRRYEISPVLAEQAGASKSRLARRMEWAGCICGNFRKLSQQIRTGNYNAVLLGAYSEYLAPLWSGQFRALAHSGVVFGAVVHDPVRDYVVGPRWWHRRSIAAAYSFLREAFVHEEIKLDTVRDLPCLRTTVIPHGPYRFPDAGQSREEVRRQWQIPEGASVALSFGHIRDGKNLDLILEALPACPSLYLVVAGKEQSPGQKPIGHYQELARKFGVQDRCRWIHGHIPEPEVGSLFVGADLTMLTYSRDFRSASGVLNASVAYHKPCVASSGGGNLRSVLEHYGLGWFVEPDNLPALKSGLEAALREPLKPRWEAYESENSWERNAQLVKEKMFGPIS